MELGKKNYLKGYLLIFILISNIFNIFSFLIIFIDNYLLFYEFRHEMLTNTDVFAKI